MLNFPLGKEVFVCDDFFSDIKALGKRNPRACTAREEIRQEMLPAEALSCIPLTEGILNVILDPESNHGVVFGKQPFLTQKLKLFKLRYAIDNLGKSKGIRIIYALNEKDLIFIHAYSKRPTPDERKVEGEIVHRLKIFLKL
jgi:hypothetical protein